MLAAADHGQPDLRAGRQPVRRPARHLFAGAGQKERSTATPDSRPPARQRRQAPDRSGPGARPWSSPRPRLGRINGTTTVTGPRRGAATPSQGRQRHRRHRRIFAIGNVQLNGNVFVDATAAAPNRIRTPRRRQWQRGTAWSRGDRGHDPETAASCRRLGHRQQASGLLARHRRDRARRHDPAGDRDSAVNVTGRQLVLRTAAAAPFSTAPANMGGARPGRRHPRHPTGGAIALGNATMSASGFGGPARPAAPARREYRFRRDRRAIPVQRRGGAGRDRHRRRQRARRRPRGRRAGRHVRFRRATAAQARGSRREPRCRGHRHRRRGRQSSQARRRATGRRQGGERPARRGRQRRRRVQRALRVADGQVAGRQCATMSTDGGGGDGQGGNVQIGTARDGSAHGDRLCPLRQRQPARQRPRRQWRPGRGAGRRRTGGSAAITAAARRS